MRACPPQHHRDCAPPAGGCAPRPTASLRRAGGAPPPAQGCPPSRAPPRHWDTISTGAHHGRDISPVAAEVEDLVLRTGRLAYDNPRWTPDRADASPARDPAHLAATVSDL